MGRPSKPKPKSKSHPYAKDTVKSTPRSSRSSKSAKSRVDEAQDVMVPNVPVDGVPSSTPPMSQIDQEPVGLCHNANVSVVSELSELKKTINSMSNLLGSFLTTMSSLVTSSSDKNVNGNTMSQNENQGMVVDQPISLNINDENLGQGSQDMFVNMQGQSVLSQNVDSSIDMPIPTTQNITPEVILQQAVNEHIAAVTDVSHHPPGKRFDVIGKLLDRRVNDKVKKDIWENKYVDLHLLLPQDDKEECSPILAPGKPGEHAKWQEPKITKGKLSIDEWCQAFCVYISVYTRKFNESTPGLMAYYNKVQSLAAKGGNFIYYDQEFRVAREQEGIPWHVPLLDLWMECLPLQETVSEQATVSKQVNNSYNNNFRPSKVSGGSNKKQFHHPKGYCYNFHNTGKCSKGSDCRFSHQCWVPSCQGRHPVFKCYKIKSGTTFTKQAESTTNSQTTKTPNPGKK